MMSNKKKQTAVVAVATVLSVSMIANPLMLKAEEQGQTTTTNIGLPDNDDKKAETEKETIDKPHEALKSTNSVARAGVQSPRTSEIPFDEEHFPDNVFRAYLKDELKIDKDDSGTLSEPEIAAVERIDIRERANLKSLKGLEYFTALESLVCSETGITELNIKENKKLVSVYLYKNMGITSLDTSNNTALDTIYCYSTRIESLDLSKNKNLESLNCSSTNLKTLDVSENTKLKGLTCYDTNIKSLDISKNTALIFLRCYNTKIESLDVSNCTALQELTCQDTPLAYLEIGSNALPVLRNLEQPEPSSINLKEKAKTFNITDKFTGINPAKIRVTKGAKYESNTGIVSEYDDTVPIEYSYDCGTYNNKPVTLNVKLNIIQKEESTIEISDNDLDKSYDGTAVSSTPAITKTGSTGAVTYKWEQLKKGVTWEKISGAPTDAGTYRVSAHMAEDDDYKAADSLTKEFTIWRADNNWSSGLAIDNWMYGSPANKPLAALKFGTVSYTYSNSPTGTFIKDVPTAVGFWYVKAAVSETDNYTGLENTIAFEITKANAPTIMLPTNLRGIQNDLLSTVKLPDGWVWSDSKQPLTIGNNGYKARFAVDDTNYDYTGVADYNASGHYVEKILPVAVSLKQNNWSIVPSIEDWTYGETASTPAGSTTYGTTAFTYSDSKTGPFSRVVPTSAGTWYMKASVAANDTYTGLDTIIKFTIMPKHIETDNQIKIPDLSADINLQALTLMDGNQILIQGTDYDVTQIQDGNKVVVTITFKGNYTGTVVQAYTNEEKDKNMQMDSSDTQKESGKNESDKKDTLNNANPETVPTGDTTAKGIWTMFMLFAAGVGAFMRKRFVKK